MELSGYFGTARRWWLPLLAAIVLATVGGYLVASRLPAIYEAEVRVLVGPLNTNFDTQRAGGQLANTYAQLVASRPIAEAAIGRARVDRSPEDLQDAMTAIPNDVTRIVVIRIQDREPQVAADLANAVAGELAARTADTARPEGQIQVIDPATTPTTPVAPQVLLIVLLAAFAGLVAAISVVVLIEYVRDTVRSEDELRELSGAPILGRLQTRFAGKGEFPSAVLRPGIIDTYRAMTARIEHGRGAGQLRSILVAGVQADGQAGLVAAGLALAFAHRGLRATLIDANPEQPSASLALGLWQPAPAERPSGDSTVHPTRVSFAVRGERPDAGRSVSLSVVPSFATSDSAKVEALQDQLDSALERADVTIITSPPVDRSPQAMLWARLIDAVVLVVPFPGVRRRDVRANAEALAMSEIWLGGTIFTDSSRAGAAKFPVPRSAVSDRAAPVGDVGLEDPAVSTVGPAEARRESTRSVRGRRPRSLRTE